MKAIVSLVLCWDAALPSLGKYRKQEHGYGTANFLEIRLVDSEVIANRPKGPVIRKFGSQLMRTSLLREL